MALTIVGSAARSSRVPKRSAASATRKAATAANASSPTRSITSSRSSAAAPRRAGTRGRSAARVTRARAATKGGVRGATAKPFTVAHFVAWAGELVLDNGDRWRPEQFQVDFVEDLFAGRLENWFIVPEGNGKSTLIGGLALYHCEFTDGAYVPVAASARDQAEVLYRQAEGFVLRSPRLRRIFKCLEGYRRIRHIKNRSRIQVFAADAKTGDGVIPTLCIVEELHRHKDLTLYRTWRGKLRKRKGSQIVTISTAGEPYSEFEETREKIRQLPDTRRAGAFVRAASDQIVLHDWALSAKADVTDIRLVKQANPFSGITLETLREDFDSPTMTIPHWSRFKCNVPKRSANTAISEFEWDRAKTTERIPEGTSVWLGLDVAWKWDTCALVPLWARDRKFRLLGPATILTPPRDGTSLAPDVLHAALLEVHGRTPIHTVVMDITRAEETAAWIKDELGVEVIEWPQSNENAVVEYEKWMTGLRTGWLWHSGDKGLTRHVMNAIARMLPNGKTRFERKSTTRQGGDQEARVIDALVAASMVNVAVAENFGEDAEPLVSWA